MTNTSTILRFIPMRTYNAAVALAMTLPAPVMATQSGTAAPVGFQIMCLRTPTECQGGGADRIHDARAKRALFLPTELLSEPAWDSLLALFAATARGGTLSTTRACDASGAPMATALRWLGTLTQLGLVETIPCPTDLRVRNLRLTPKGLATMVNLLTELNASSI